MSDVVPSLQQMLWLTEGRERHIAFILFGHYCSTDGAMAPEFKKYISDTFTSEEIEKLQEIRLVLIGLVRECASINHELEGPLEDKKFMSDHVNLLNDMGPVNARAFWDTIPNNYILSDDARMWLLYVELQKPEYNCSAEQQLLDEICGKFLPSADSLILMFESDGESD
jgi:hypothetical protein